MGCGWPSYPPGKAVKSGMLWRLIHWAGFIGAAWWAMTLADLYKEPQPGGPAIVFVGLVGAFVFHWIARPLLWIARGIAWFYDPTPGPSHEPADGDGYPAAI